MAEKSFALNTDPHVANVGPHRLLFQPEVIGAVFADAYAGLKEAQQGLKAAGENVGAEELTAIHNGMRDFVRRFLLAESATLFDTIQLPDRVLAQLLEYAAELYGSGSGNVPGGSSSAS